MRNAIGMGRIGGLVKPSSLLRYRHYVAVGLNRYFESRKLAPTAPPIEGVRHEHYG